MVLEEKRPWWGGRTSNPVGAARRSQVGSTPILFRHFPEVRPVPALAETFLSRLADDAAAGDRAEAELRREFGERLAQVERERVFANRRLHLMRCLAAAVEGAEDDAAALAAGDRVIEAEFGLSRASEAHGVIMDRFRPVADAVDTLLNCEAEPDHAAVLGALASFEQWYEAHTGKPFLALYDVYRAQTPVVDF